jgi:hypothetical protein
MLLALSALRKRRFQRCLLLLAAMAVFPAAHASAEDWYGSNAAAMTLERLTRAVALREAYCLSVAVIDSANLPASLRSYHDGTFRIELHTLYERGNPSRQQWIFRDERGTTRLVAAFDAVPAPGEEAGEVEESGEATSPSGFIEVYNEEYLIMEEHEFMDDGAESIRDYVYNGKALIRVESGVKAAVGEALWPVTTDYYRYTRAQSLRTVERVYHAAAPPKVSDTAAAEKASDTTATGEADTVAEAGKKASDTASAEPAAVAEAGKKTSDTTSAEPAAVAEAGKKASDTASAEPAAVAEAREKVSDTPPPPVRLQFPRPGAAPEINFVSPNSLYASSAPTSTPATSEGGEKVVYTTDARGRMLTETRQDADGAVLSEMRQTWDKDRLTSIVWKSGKTERRTEFDYNADGDRVMERNYNNAMLERSVRQEGGREIEELYLNGIAVLRAVWQDGRKLSEERVR